MVIPGCPHHVTQRGNRREAVFFDDGDRRRFLDLLKRYADKGGLGIQAYCLMPNHLHLLAVPKAEDSLSAALKPLFLRYAQHVNWRQGQSGRLWQGRFYSCPLDELHQWGAIRYVERNPVRAGLVERAAEYAWSSAAAHCGLRSDPLLAPLPEGMAAAIGDWSAWLADAEDAAVVAAIRRNTATGRPAGGDGFVGRLESLLGRRRRPMKRGRPRKPLK